MKPLSNAFSSQEVDGIYHIAMYIYNSKTGRGWYPWNQDQLEIPKNSGVCIRFEIYARKLQLTYLPGLHIHRLLSALWTEWPHFSGDQRYPIPGTKYYKTPYLAYSMLKNIWSGDQREYRLNLLEYIIHRTALTLNKRNYLKVPIPPYEPLDF